ncbi:CgeB family protein [Alkaliphilus pronyensis]
MFFLDHRTYCINSLGDSLSQLGHSLALQSSWSPEEVEAGIRIFKPNILITVGYNRPLFNRFSRKVHELCSKYKLFHLYWATEDIINHFSWSLPYVKDSKPDLVWTIHKDCIKKYEALGIPALYFNFGLNPRIFPAKKKNEAETFDISLVCATHLFKETYRFQSFQDLLFPLVKAGIDTNIWGYGWKKDSKLIKETFGHTIPKKWLRGHLLYGETASVYRKSKIVLGVQNSEEQVTQRTFEILGSGGFMIASRTKALSSMFKDKVEIVLSSSPTETVELVNYYINRPDIRYEIGCNGRKRVLEDYTYLSNLKRIWPDTELLIEKKLMALS